MKPATLVIPVALLSFATACGSDSTSGSAPAAKATAKPPVAAGAVLTGQVSDPFSISFVDGKGAKVTTLKAGSYEVKVTDSSAHHNFHLMGPGVKETTTVPGTSPTTWTVKLSAGTYTFQCDPHAAKGMKGTFTVT